MIRFFKKRLRNITDHSRVLDVSILFLVFLSIGLTIAEMQGFFNTPETLFMISWIHVCILVVFLLELIYRYWLAPHMYPKLNDKQSRIHFLTHPLTIIDIIVVSPLLFVPFYGLEGISDLIVLRVLRISALLNLFKIYRSSHVIQILTHVIKEVWNELLITFVLALQVVLVSTILTYHFESAINPQINDFFDSFYYSIMAITTVGFGDIVPLTTGGRWVIIVGSVIGVGLVALPAAILAAGFFRAMRMDKTTSDRKRRKELKHWLHEEEEVDLLPLD